MHFRLVRRFSLTSLMFFALAGAELGSFHREIAISRTPGQMEMAGISSPELKNDSRIQETHRRAVAIPMGRKVFSSNRNTDGI